MEMRKIRFGLSSCRWKFQDSVHLRNSVNFTRIFDYIEYEKICSSSKKMPENAEKYPLAFGIEKKLWKFAEQKSIDY